MKSKESKWVECITSNRRKNVKQDSQARSLWGSVQTKRIRDKTQTEKWAKYWELTWTLLLPFAYLKTQKPWIFLTTVTYNMSKLQSSRLTTLFSYNEVSYHWPCICLLKFPSFLPENSICINPSVSDEYDFFDKLPMCVGRDSKMEAANGKMSFPFFRLMYMK